MPEKVRKTMAKTTTDAMHQDAWAMSGEHAPLCLRPCCGPHVESHECAGHRINLRAIKGGQRTPRIETADTGTGTLAAD